MAELPVLPLKVGDLLSDTTHMSAEEFGAYCRILFTMWRHGGRLADDAKELAHIAGVTPNRWKIIAERVRRPLTSVGGVLSQKRLTDTWLSVQDLRRTRAAAATRRWQGPQHEQTQSKRHANAHANQDAKADANAMQNDAIKKKKKESTSSESRAARANHAEVQQNQDNSAGELATALRGGALTRPPDAEPAATQPKLPYQVRSPQLKQQLDHKR